MSTNYVQPGEVIQYTAGTDISANTVVRIGNLLGVAAVDIANGETGSVKVTGVHRVPKVSGAVITQGQTVMWDASAGAFDDNAATPATGDVTGQSAVAWEDAGNGVTSMLVKFTGVPGTVT